MCKKPENCAEIRKIRKNHKNGAGICKNLQKSGTLRRKLQKIRKCAGIRKIRNKNRKIAQEFAKKQKNAQEFAKICTNNKKLRRNFQKSEKTQ